VATPKVGGAVVNNHGRWTAMKRKLKWTLVAVAAVSVVGGSAVAVKLTAAPASSTPAVTEVGGTEEAETLVPETTPTTIAAVIEQGSEEGVVEVPNEQQFEAQVPDEAPVQQTRPQPPEAAPTPGIEVPDVTQPVTPYIPPTPDLPSGYTGAPVLPIGPYGPDKDWTCEQVSATERVCW
jgi:hypothetical protein